MPRFRYSLLSLLLFTTIVALIVSHVRTSMKLSAATAELRMLRLETGYLAVSDPDKIHAIELPTLEEKTWKWRIYVPDGKRATVSHAFNKIPKEGLPKREGRTGGLGFIDSGETIVTAAFRKGAEGQWQLIVEATSFAEGQSRGGTSTRTNMSPDRLSWLDVSRGHRTQGVSRTTSVMNGDDPLTLIRLRVNKPVQQANGAIEHKVSEEACDGLMIWIEQR